MPLCPNCGAQLRDGAKFCEACGQPFTGATSSVVRQNGSKMSKKWVAVGLIMGLVLGMLIFIPLGARYGAPAQQQTLVAYVTRNVVQQVTVFVTQTITQGGFSTTSVVGPYVVIRYSGKAVSSISFSNPAAGNIFLVVSMQIENHGYDRFPVSWSYFYVIIGNHQYTYSSSTFSLADELSSSDVLNGLTVTGSIAYEVPANYGAFNLLYKPIFGQYNVQYVQQ